MISGRAAPANSRWCSGLYGSINPISGRPGATPAATVASSCRGASTMGRRIDVSALAAMSSMLQSSRAAANDETITANGLSSRAFRRRNSATAA